MSVITAPAPAPLPGPAELAAREVHDLLVNAAVEEHAVIDSLEAEWRTANPKQRALCMAIVLLVQRRLREHPDETRCHR